MDAKKKQFKSYWAITALCSAGLLCFVGDASLVFWNVLFLSGLFLFMIGGAFLLLEKRVFDAFFRSFQVFKRKTSKVEAYVYDRGDSSQAGNVQETGIPSLTRHLLGYGGLVIIISTICSFYSVG